jgi:hypothetical protein
MTGGKDGKGFVPSLGWSITRCTPTWLLVVIYMVPCCGIQNWRWFCFVDPTWYSDDISVTSQCMLLVSTYFWSSHSSLADPQFLLIKRPIFRWSKHLPTVLLENSLFVFRLHISHVLKINFWRVRLRRTSTDLMPLIFLTPRFIPVMPATIVIVSWNNNIWYWLSKYLSCFCCRRSTISRFMMDLVVHLFTDENPIWPLLNHGFWGVLNVRGTSTRWTSPRGCNSPRFYAGGAATTIEAIGAGTPCCDFLDDAWNAGCTMVYHQKPIGLPSGKLT